VRVEGCSRSQISQHTPSDNAQDAECLTLQEHVLLHPLVSASSSSSDGDLLQCTAASAKPTCRRRAALDSDSDTEKSNTQQSRQDICMALHKQSPSVYDFNMPGSSQSDSAASMQGDGTSSPSRHAAQSTRLLSAAAQSQKRMSSVIILDSSDDNDGECYGASSTNRIDRYAFMRHIIILCVKHPDCCNAEQTT